MTILLLCAPVAVVVMGSQGIANMYKRVYLIFTTKMQLFVTYVTVMCPGSSGSDE